jgi:hypothetical protein
VRKAAPRYGTGASCGARPAIDELADQLGEVDAALKALEAERSRLREAFLATGRMVVSGRRYRVERRDHVRVALDTAVIRRVMSAEWVDAHSKRTVVPSVTCRAVEEAT